MALAPSRMMIVAFAMTIPLTPTLSRKRARGTQGRYATFTLILLCYQRCAAKRLFFSIPSHAAHWTEITVKADSSYKL